MILYPLRSTREGRKIGEFPVGQLNWDGASVEVDIPDRDLCRQVRELFDRPVRVRVPRGEPETVLSHSWETLEPGTEAHFQACLRRLHRLGLSLGR